jgi:hypothetical protein
MSDYNRMHLDSDMATLKSAHHILFLPGTTNDD